MTESQSRLREVCEATKIIKIYQTCLLFRKYVLGFFDSAKKLVTLLPFLAESLQSLADAYDIMRLWETIFRVCSTTRSRADRSPLAAVETRVPRRAAAAEPLSPRDCTRELARGDEPRPVRFSPMCISSACTGRQRSSSSRGCTYVRCLYICKTRIIIYCYVNLINITYERARAPIRRAEPIFLLYFFIFCFSSPGRTANYHIIIQYTSVSRVL